MTTTPPRPDRTGAYRDERHRRGGAWLWWLLGLLVLAVIIAVIVILLVVHHHSKKTAAVRPVAAASASVPVPGPSTTATPQTKSASAPANSASAPAASASALVGGGGIALKPAAGSEAVSGVVGTVLFSEASANVDATGERVIAAAAQQLKTKGITTVTVTGYTDFIAGQKVNNKLSQERAAAVAAKLRTLLPGVTVIANAKGQQDPFAPNATAAGRAQNRRVVMTVS